MIGEAVVNALADAGKAADWARSGWEATGFLSENKYDALLLDLGLPGKDGMSVLRELRAKDSETPVVILTARDGLDDRLAGLDAGADDYVVKPFSYVRSAGKVARHRTATPGCAGRKQSAHQRHDDAQLRNEDRALACARG